MDRMSNLSSDFKARLQQFGAKVASMESEYQAAHRARMARLPDGTCERCYGEGCLDCRPIVMVAPGVPVEFALSTLANYREMDGSRTALARARAFREGTRDMYLTGGVGAGKTRLACAILNDCFSHRIGSLFVRVPMMLHQLQPGRHADDVAEFERRLLSVPVLVMDDIGAERDQATDYTRRTILMVYEERHDRGLRTIWTSNKTLSEVGQMQDDDRLVSRIAGRAEVVKLSTADQRVPTRLRGVPRGDE